LETKRKRLHGMSKVRQYKTLEWNRMPFEYPYEDYENLRVIGLGAFGLVCKATQIRTRNEVAIKKVTECFQSDVHAERAYREIMFLKTFDHPNLLSLLDVYIAPSNVLYLVTEYFGTDLSSIIQKKILTPKDTKGIIYQVFTSLKYVHSLGIIHRDLKPNNILISSDRSVKLCDFGASRTVQRDLEMTGYVVTRYYRAPEILLTWRHYSTAADIWSAGCILAELLIGKILFHGNDYLRQIHLIFQLLGSPPLESFATMEQTYVKDFCSKLGTMPRQDFYRVFQGLDPLVIDLLEKTLTLSPDDRISAADALEHPYFAEVRNPEDEESASAPIQLLSGPEVHLAEWKTQIERLVDEFVPPPDDTDED
jgi:p38 MAP kinase